MDRSELESKLDGLPAEVDFGFELRLTELARSLDDADTAVLFEIARDKDREPDMRYAAYYALCIYFRRLKEFAELRDITREFADLFGDRPLAPHLRSLYLKETTDSVNEAIACARRAVENAPGHAGVLHNLAQLLTQQQEAADDISPAVLDEAEASVRKAIALTGGAYGRYYAAQARIRILKGLYVEAEADLNYAIDKEEVASKDYALRVGEYQLIKLEARFSRIARRLREQQQRAVQDLNEVRDSVDQKLEIARSESLQMLGLLTAVIAFVVTGAQVATGAGPIDVDTTGRVLVLAAGAVTAIFGLSAIALFPLTWERAGRSVLVTVCGALVVLASVSWWEWLT